MIELDGSVGEGGGQILRTALSLSMITGAPFRIRKIRAGRKRPGLLLQHLFAVEAARQICSARVEGAELGSAELRFVPGEIRAGSFEFAIGSAGSTTLVLQTLLPALLCAPGSSAVRVSGGTHNPLAPSFEFLERTFLPAIRSMGAVAHAALLRPGFYPAGGGEIELQVEPAQLRPIELLDRGALRCVWARATVVNLPEQIARRELDVVGRILSLDRTMRRQEVLTGELGVGNVLSVGIECEAHTEIVSVCGEKNLAAEHVAERAGAEAAVYLASSGAVGEHLADQLLLPCALAGGGRFTMTACSSHFETNAMVIGKFVPFNCAVSPVARSAIALLPEESPDGSTVPAHFLATIESEPIPG